MNAEQESRYLQELMLNLQRESFTARPETEGRLLTVELDGRPHCRVTGVGAVRYRPEEANDPIRSEALERVADIAKVTAEYMSLMETASFLTASGLTGDYRLLTEFNDVVLAGHPTQYGIQFVTWGRVQERTGLNAGNYYGPGAGVDGYTAAKRDFTVRSGLLPSDLLFTQEQLAVIFDAAQNMTTLDLVSNPEHGKLLDGIMEQIERAVPQVIDLANELTQYPQEHEPGEMQLC